MPAAFPVPTGGPASSCLTIPRVRCDCQVVLEGMDSSYTSFYLPQAPSTVFIRGQVPREALLNVTDSNSNEMLKEKVTPLR